MNQPLAIRAEQVPECQSQAFLVYDTARENQKAYADVVGSKFFGEAERLAKKDQIARNHAQFVLTKRMNFVLS